MAGRSYLRRIAQPVVPGAPQLTPLPSPLAHERHPLAMQSAHHKVIPARATKTPSPREQVAPASFSAGPEAPHPVAVATDPPVAPHSDLTGPEPEAGVVPARPPIAHAQTQRDLPIRPASSPAIEQDWGGGTGALPDPMRKAPRAPHAIPNVHIGTVEVRTRPAPAPVPTPAPARPLRAAPAAPQSPLSRGLAWRYGLVQG